MMTVRTWKGKDQITMFSVCIPALAAARVKALQHYGQHAPAIKELKYSSSEAMNVSNAQQS